MIKRYARMIDRMQQLPAADRHAIERALKRIRTKAVTRGAALDMVADIVQAAARTRAKRAQDAASDHARRCLVGARLPRETANRYRAAAAEKGVSLYRWVSDALQSAYQLQSTTYGGEDHENHKTLR